MRKKSVAAMKATMPACTDTDMSKTEWIPVKVVTFDWIGQEKLHHELHSAVGLIMR